LVKDGGIVTCSELSVYSCMQNTEQIDKVQDISAQGSKILDIGERTQLNPFLMNCIFQRSNQLQEGVNRTPQAGSPGAWEI